MSFFGRIRQWSLGKSRRRVAGLTWITPDWAVGPAPRRQVLTSLVGEGIAAIVDLRAEASLEPEEVAAAGLEVLRLPVDDGAAPSQEQLAQGASWVIEQASHGHKVLLCCRAGRGRSVTLACSVLVQMGYPLEQALLLVTQARSTAQLSDVQIAALTQFAATRARQNSKGQRQQSNVL